MLAKAQKKKVSNEEALLCASWFIALFFIGVQLVSMNNYNQDMRRATRVRARQTTNRITKRKELCYQ